METINKTVHSEVRLYILMNLYKNSEILFTTLKKQLEIPAGTLSSHLAVLKKEKYIHVKKKFNHNKPETMLSITDKGKLELKNYYNIILNLFEEYGLKGDLK